MKSYLPPRGIPLPLTTKESPSLLEQEAQDLLGAPIPQKQSLLAGNQQCHGGKTSPYISPQELSTPDALQQESPTRETPAFESPEPPVPTDEYPSHNDAAPTASMPPEDAQEAEETYKNYPSHPEESSQMPELHATSSGQEKENTSDHWPPMADILGSLFVFEPCGARSPVTVVGLGSAPPLSLSQLPPCYQDAIAKADILAGGQRLLDLFPNEAAERIPLSSPLKQALQHLQKAHSAGQRIVVLADGDPLFYGIGSTLIRLFGASSVQIFPGISSLQEACSRLALPWHNVICLSLHGREDVHPLNVAVTKDRPICILTDATTTPDIIARHLLDRGVDWFHVHVFEHMGTPEEKTYALTLAETANTGFSNASTLILLPSQAARRPLMCISDKDLSPENGLITTKPVRAAALSLLQIAPHHCVWDIGAGSGAVSLEATALAYEGAVIAIECSTGRAFGIQEKRRRFGAATLEIHLGTAPDCLPELPDPDRVFIGGGLNSAEAGAILGHVAHRLPIGGRVVISSVLLGTLQHALRFFEKMRWETELVSIQAAEGKPLAGDIRLAAFNPIFLVAATKADEHDILDA